MNYKLITTEKLKSFKTKFFNLLHSKITGYVTNDKKYKIDVNENGNYYVNVPWTDTNSDYAEKAKLIGYPNSQFEENEGEPQKISVDDDGNYYVRISKGIISNYDWGFEAHNGFLQINATQFARQLFREATNIQGVIVDNETGNIYLGVTQHKVGNPTVPGYTLYGDYFLADTLTYNANSQSTEQLFSFGEAMTIKEENIVVTQSFNFGPSETITVTATSLTKEALQSINNISALAMGKPYWTSTLNDGSHKFFVLPDGSIYINQSTHVGGYYTGLDSCAVRLGFKNPFANRT